MTLKILYVAPYVSDAFSGRHEGSGAVSLAGQRKVELVCGALVEKGHEVMVLSSAVPGGHRLRWRGCEEEKIACGKHEVAVRYPGVLEFSPLGGLINVVRARRLVETVEREYRPDVLWLYNGGAFEYGAARARGGRSERRVILQIEDMPLARRRKWGNVKPRLDARVWPEVVAIASAFTVANPRMRERLPKEKPALVLPGVIDERLVTLSGTRRVPFLGSRRLLGYFGGLTEAKGVSVLGDVLKHLPEPWDVVVCGSGPLAPYFRELEKANRGRFRFEGVVSSEALYELMCSCDCLFVPQERISGGEGGVFPFKVLEYVVAGGHVIAPILAGSDEIGIGFVQRWNGGAEDLIACLMRSERDFSADSRERGSANTLVRKTFGAPGVASALNELLQTIT